MIVYDLECENSHRFEGWFGCADDYDKQLTGKLLSCPMCNSGDVVRRPSAAYLNTGAVEKSPREQAKPANAAPQQYANVPPEIVAKVIEHIIKNTEDVGKRFPEEAARPFPRDPRRLRSTPRKATPASAPPRQPTPAASWK